MVRPRTLTVYLSLLDGPSNSASVRFLAPTDRFDEILEAAKSGLRACWQPGCTATHMHLIASELVRPAGWHRTLFDPPYERADRIAKVKREINQRLGRFKLRSGATLFANDFYHDPANSYDVCDIRGKFCF